MKTRILIAILTLSLVAWAQTPAPTTTPKAKTAAADCECCKGMAKDHTCADCCKDGKCDMKDGASCPMMKDAKAKCMTDKGCCGMDHSSMKHDNASAKPDVAAGNMGAHCSMAKDGKGCCGMHGSTGKTTGK